MDKKQNFALCVCEDLTYSVMDFFPIFPFFLFSHYLNEIARV